MNNTEFIEERLKTMKEASVALDKVRKRMKAGAERFLKIRTKLFKETIK